ncbi:MAG: type II/IV secretion system protein [Myxococcales bacterium]|nr:type II/IV secretion system protein [Myxococcales bacterium]
MSATVRGLLGIAVLGLLAGAAAIAASVSFDGAWAEIVRQFWVVFGSGGWGWLLRVAGIAGGFAVVLTLAELLFGLRRKRGHADYEGLETGNVQEAIVEVRRRIADCTAEAPDVVAAFTELVRGAVKVSASDIHVSPTPDALKLTYRVHGTLHEVALLDPSVQAPLVTRVKVLARLDTYVKNTPQDGRLVMTIDDGSIEARVSTLPTEGGERVVLRLVRGSRAVPDVESLAFNEEVMAGVIDLVNRPQGLLFVTGPVGSGKTTTLYAALKQISRSRGRTTTLVTLEDPIELELPFATQTQMHPKAGMTFAGTLRSVLRQDPNVLMVGEIRDRETAEIAMQAGLTGHLILTTVHGQSAAGVFARLIEMGIEPFILASATVGCLSQRLVRTLCTACRREAKPDAIVTERFAESGIVIPDGIYYEHVGCDFCEGQGFTGRLPIAELLILNEAVRAAINKRSPTNELHQVATAEGMTPLMRDGLLRAQRGETSLMEVLRVTG